MSAHRQNYTPAAVIARRAPHAIPLAFITVVVLMLALSVWLQTREARQPVVTPVHQAGSAVSCVPPIAPATEQQAAR